MTGPDEPAEEASRAIATTTEAVGSIISLLTTRGMICLDLADVATVLRGGARGVFGQGEAAGPGRARAAAEAAIEDLRRALAMPHGPSGPTAGAVGEWPSGHGLAARSAATKR